MDSPDSTTVAAVLALALVALCSIRHARFGWSAVGLGHGLSKPCALAGNYSSVRKLAWYEDVDGKSTPESIAKYDARLRRVKAANLVLAAAGTGVAVVVAVLNAQSVPRQHYGAGRIELRIEDGRPASGAMTRGILGIACWAVVLCQAVVITASYTTAAFWLGAYSVLSSLGLLAAALPRALSSWVGAGGGAGHEPPCVRALCACQAVAASLLAVSCASIPRRPDVYDASGVMIDPEWSCSLVSETWYNFFARTTIAAAVRGRGALEVADLTRPAHAAKAETFAMQWRLRWGRQKETRKKQRDGRENRMPLWRQVAWMHRWKFARQAFISVVLGTSRMAPCWSLHRLLTELEKLEGLDGYTEEHAKLLVWTALLVAIMVFETWTGHITYSFAWGHFSVPVRNQLVSLVFEKVMRAKDVKGVNRDASRAGRDGDGDADDGAKAGEPTQARTDKKKNRQSINEVGANIIGIDVERVAFFCAMHVGIPINLTVFVEACALLGVILGPRPMLCGVAGMLAVVAASMYGMRRYAAARHGLMDARDAKAAVVGEALAGIRQIKFAALEDLWEARVASARAAELSWVRRTFVAQAVLVVSSLGAPIVLTIVSFAAYAYLVGPPGAPDVFACFAMFQALIGALNNIPDSVKSVLDAWVSINRIDRFLQLAEVRSVKDPDASEISFRIASFAWPADPYPEEDDDDDDGLPCPAAETRFVLRDVTVTFPRGALSLVTGKTGTGKTLLLAAILGEADVLSGTVSVPGPQRFDNDDDDADVNADAAPDSPDWIVPNAVAYAPQIPWIENASIAANVTFGLPRDRGRFDAVIEACALAKDLAMLPDGERTEVGVNGINLSGGQKWRLSLARAVYSRAEVLVLDDMFSAVDAHVGRHLYERCLGGDVCRGRTVILVTHHVGLCLPMAAYLVELGDGGVMAHAGPVRGSSREDGTLACIIAREAEEARREAAARARKEEEEEREEERRREFNGGDCDRGASGPGGNRGRSAAAPTVSVSPPSGHAPPPPTPRKFVEAEKRARGAVAARVWSRYIAYGGGWWVGLLATLVFALQQAINMASSWWLGVWAGAPEGAAGRVSFYLGVYCVFGVLTILVLLLRSWVVFSTSLRASRALFARFNAVVLSAPVGWFDRTPLGRVLNRYTGDFASVDVEMTESVASGGMAVFGLLAMVVSGALVAPGVLVGLAVLVVPWRPMARGYLAAVRPCVRLSSTTRATVLQSLITSVQGVATLRAFGRARAAMARVHAELDDWGMAIARMQLCNRYMGVRSGTLAGLFSGIVAVFVVLWPGVTASMAGFALAFAFTTNSVLYMLLAATASIELAMASTERILEYVDEIEPERPTAGSPAPAAWPARGDVAVEGLTVGYADDLPPVLRGVSFAARGGERVGVVGRTGAGKSTLSLSLFRFVDARAGRICIDGLDISELRLRDLRSRLAIIPQDPILFSGTIRSNLDPYGRHADADLAEALQRVRLGDLGGGNVGTKYNSTSGDDSPSSTAIAALSAPVSNGGLNLSQGQRQLLCLARAMVSRPRVLVLDEATSAVDTATDGLIQTNIRSEFGGCTMIVVAHRLATVADFDKILVLADGEVAEFGTPHELWGDEAERDRARWGVFRGMCESSGDAERLRVVVTGQRGRGADV